MLKKSLSLLILSLFFLPAIAASQEEDEGLELPEVYIYGTHLGKIQLSPKKDFFPYLSKGNLFPHSRPLAPELRIPVHRRMPHEVSTLQRYWLLFDAGAGNWWSDRVFLDCGLRNSQGLIGLRFTDFRRKNWAQDHSKTEDFIQLKGALGQENYYISGNLYYGFDQFTDSSDTASSQSGGINLYSRIDLQQIQFSLLGDFSMARLPNGYRNLNGDPTTVSENTHAYSARADYHTGMDLVAFAQLKFDGANKEESAGSTENSLFITTADIGMKRTFGALSISPGVRIFMEREKVAASPHVSANAALEGIGVFPFAGLFEKRSVNACMDIYRRNPFDVVDLGEYKTLLERRIYGGFEGRRSWFEYLVMYTHQEFNEHPDIAQGVPPAVRYVKAKRDRIYSSFAISYLDFELNATGHYTFNEDVIDEGYPEQDRLLYEPISRVSIGTTYTGYEILLLSTGISSSFAVKTHTEDVDIFSLDARAAYKLANNLWLGLGVENIFDQRYEIWPGYTEGGIQFYGSLKYKLLQ